jgi:hypothetical protein
MKKLIKNWVIKKIIISIIVAILFSMLVPLVDFISKIILQ